MRNSFLLALVLFGFASCSNFGKKVKIDGTKTEVYYKGEGVTESDAKKTGGFLKDIFITADKEASLQLTREGETYTLRFVYDRKAYDTIKGAEDEFKLIGARVSKEVFGGKKVNIALANSRFKDFKTIPFDEAVAKSLEAPAGQEVVKSKAEFDHNSQGGVNFYWKGISDDDSKMISDYIVKNGAFGGGSAEIYITKDGDRYILRFPMIASARNDPAYQAEVGKVSKQIKENVFPNAPFSFYITDEQLQTVKAYDY